MSTVIKCRVCNAPYKDDEDYCPLCKFGGVITPTLRKPTVDAPTHEVRNTGWSMYPDSPLATKLFTLFFVVALAVASYILGSWS